MSNLPYTATPLAEPRSYRHTLVNHEIKCESDHTFQKQRHPAGPNPRTCTNRRDKELHPLRNTLLTKESREIQVMNSLKHQDVCYLDLHYNLPLYDLEQQSQGTKDNMKQNLCICQKHYVMMEHLNSKHFSRNSTSTLMLHIGQPHNVKINYVGV